jgi:iron-sulfur cluster assembly protein
LGSGCATGPEQIRQLEGSIMAISLTEAAADRVRTYLEKREKGLGLRLGVTKTGCSGYVFEDKGVTVVIDPEALSLIDGTEVDFVKNGLNEAFSFRNPNIKGECGCGESFNV